MTKKYSKKKLFHIDMTLDAFKSRIKTTDINMIFIFGSIVLVFFIGLYAIFSPSAHNGRLTNPACGKIVVASNGSSMNAEVASTLSNAPYFLVINQLSSKLLEVAKNPYATGTQVVASDVAYFVAGKGEEAVIAGSIQPKCYAILTQFGIRVFGGYSGKVKDAVDLYRQARISQAPVRVQGGQQVAFGSGGQPFVCPQCHWRLYEQKGVVQCPQCPNCGVLMVHSGAFGSGHQRAGDIPNQSLQETGVVRVALGQNR